MSHSLVVHPDAKAVIAFIAEDGSYRIIESKNQNYTNEDQRTLDDIIINVGLQRFGYLYSSEFDQVGIGYLSVMAENLLNSIKPDMMTDSISMMLAKKHMAILVVETGQNKVTGLSFFAKEKREAIEDAVRRSIRTILRSGSQHTKLYIEREYDSPENPTGAPGGMIEIIKALPAKGILCGNLSILDRLVTTTNDYSLVMRKITTDLKLHAPKDYLIMTHKEDDEDDHVEGCDCEQEEEKKTINFPIYQHYTGNICHIIKLLEFIQKKYRCYSTRLTMIDLEFRDIGLLGTVQGVHGHFYDIVGDPLDLNTIGNKNDDVLLVSRPKLLLPIITT